VQKHQHYPYQIENCISSGNGNCRNSLQKHLDVNKSSDELYERIKSPITPTDNGHHPFILPPATFDYHVVNGIDKNTACHQHQNAANNEGDVTEEAITRFDQENYSADSDPESYLHSNSDLGEPKNAVSMPT
jgi:hypothetical protein